MNRPTPLLLAVLIAGAVTAAAAAPDPPAAPLRGPLPAPQRDLIHGMAERHDAITRTVELTETGYAARTVSVDPEIAVSIREHVAYMQARMGSGAMVRRWDPAFEEMFHHHADIDVYVLNVRDGVEVRVDGRTPEAVRVAHNHARIISGFVETGMEAVQSTHPAVLETEGAETEEESGE